MRPSQVGTQEPHPAETAAAPTPDERVSLAEGRESVTVEEHAPPVAVLAAAAPAAAAGAVEDTLMVAGEAQAEAAMVAEVLEAAARGAGVSAEAVRPVGEEAPAG